MPTQRGRWLRLPISCCSGASFLSASWLIQPFDRPEL
jgi:hypothetical protein